MRGIRPRRRRARRARSADSTARPGAAPGPRRAAPLPRPAGVDRHLHADVRRAGRGAPRGHPGGAACGNGGIQGRKKVVA